MQQRQEAVLRAFREQELNMLVSTSVLEEGIDVHHCNLVIRYDPCPTYVAYLQSKGVSCVRRAYCRIL